ncbi:deoxyuridine 5'-triphosphate nucleotidohydrolase-like [Phaethornis superciliosus]
MLWETVSNVARGHGEIAKHGLSTQTGKLPHKRVTPTRADSKSGCLDSHSAATRGSAGVDVETGADMYLVDTQVVVIDTNMKGPLGHGLSVLSLGRSSLLKQGIFVVPGLIDSDYTGRRRAMVYTPSPPFFIPKGQRFAQLVPFQSCVPQATDINREDKGFGSVGPALVNLPSRL